jgi:hypothetical protein
MGISMDNKNKLSNGAKLGLSLGGTLAASRVAKNYLTDSISLNHLPRFKTTHKPDPKFVLALALGQAVLGGVVGMGIGSGMQAIKDKLNEQI